MNDQEILDHGIHLLIDNELDEKTRKHVLNRINSNETLNVSYQNAINLKELVTQSYSGEEPSPNRLNNIHFQLMDSRRVMGLAASFVLVFGLSMGWIANDQYKQQRVLVAENDFGSFDHEVNNLETKHVRKFIFHINQNNQKKASKTFNETKTILASYATSGLPVQLDILVDQEAVRLFRPENKQQLKEVRDLINEYENINVFACSMSLRLFMNSEKLPGNLGHIKTNRVVEEIIKERKNSGWVYIEA